MAVDERWASVTDTGEMFHVNWDQICTIEDQKDRVTITFPGSYAVVTLRGDAAVDFRVEMRRRGLPARGK